MKDKKKSILQICIIHFTVFSLIIVAFFFLTRYISDYVFQSAMPVIDDIMAYEEELKAEDYSAIPIRNIKNGSFAVFDEKDKLIYSSSEEIAKYFVSDEIRFASDSYNSISYNVFERYTDGKKEYLIIKTQLDYGKGSSTITDYCVVDSKLNIIDGTLFSDMDRLTEKEFDVLQDGTISGKKSIDKATFVTDSGKQRSLALITPVGDKNFYKKVQNRSNLIWVMMIPFLLVLIIVETKLFVRRIKDVLNPIDTAVRSFEKTRKFEIEPSKVPKELESFVYDFSYLIDTLNHEKEKNEEAYKEKQRVFTNLSHDLRTPLTVIQGYSKAFIDGVVPEEKVSQYMNAMYDRVSDASNTMDSLYEYSRLEHPDYQIDIQTEDICEFCKEYLAEKYPDLEFSGFLLEFDIPDESISFGFDKILMKRLFNNIVGNSVKYNEPGVTIYFSLVEKPNEIVITIADDGKGIPESIIENAFTPFVVGDEARTKEMGTGLGLAISKRIANMHGGDIEMVYPPKPPYSAQTVLSFKK